MKTTIGFLPKAFALALTAFLLHVAPLRAAWTSLNLPPLSKSFGSYRMDHLSDGRLVYGSNNDLDRQTTFGTAPLDDYTNALTWDPSSVAVYSDTVGAVGRGTFLPSPIYLFDPSNLATGFTAITGVSIQNYTLVFRDSTSLYIGGVNGSEETAGGDPKHSISYVTTSGSVNKVIIDNISDYSGDFAMDLAGNLYVSDNDDDHKLYKFTAAQLSAAITGAALAITDGQFLTNLYNNGALAVDGLGRVWSAGFYNSGLELYDPANGEHTFFVPAVNNTNYVVATFSDGIDDYVAYINASGSGAGANLTYGYDKVGNLVPEPSSLGLCALGGLALAHRRRRP